MWWGQIRDGGVGWEEGRVRPGMVRSGRGIVGSGRGMVGSGLGMVRSGQRKVGLVGRWWGLVGGWWDKAGWMMGHDWGDCGARVRGGGVRSGIWCVTPVFQRALGHQM